MLAATFGLRVAAIQMLVAILFNGLKIEETN